MHFLDIHISKQQREMILIIILYIYHFTSLKKCPNLTSEDVSLRLSVWRNQWLPPQRDRLDVNNKQQQPKNNKYWVLVLQDLQEREKPEDPSIQDEMKREIASTTMAHSFQGLWSTMWSFGQIGPCTVLSYLMEKHQHLLHHSQHVKLPNW